MLGAVLLVQVGGAFAVTLIPQVGRLGTVALRMSLAALFLAPVVRPRLHGHTRDAWRPPTLSLGAMNDVFDLVSERPLSGVAVTVGSLGPLSVEMHTPSHVDTSVDA